MIKPILEANQSVHLHRRRVRLRGNLDFPEYSHLLILVAFDFYARSLTSADCNHSSSVYHQPKSIDYGVWWIESAVL